MLWNWEVWSVWLAVSSTTDLQYTAHIPQRLNLYFRFIIHTEVVALSFCLLLMSVFITCILSLDSKGLRSTLIQPSFKMARDRKCILCETIHVSKQVIHPQTRLIQNKGRNTDGFHVIRSGALASFSHTTNMMDLQIIKLALSYKVHVLFWCTLFYAHSFVFMY